VQLAWSSVNGEIGGDLNATGEPQASLVNPGLDRQRLLELRSQGHDEAGIVSRIREHLQTQDGYVAFSGGKDSLVVLHMALAADPSVPVAFFDSGLEFPETYAFVGQLASEWKFESQLLWITAEPPLLQVLHDTAAWDHRRVPERPIPNLHDVLISRPAAIAHQACGPGELWGVRAHESRGRAALYARALRAETTVSCTGCCQEPRERRARHGGVIRRADGSVAFGPVWDWRNEEVWRYIARHRLQVNPVYDKLRRLGAPERALRVSAMIDGNALELGRVTWLRRGWPDLFEELAQVLPRLREFV
jgi:phosphoadenosine phosphosulfate reductase